MATLADNLNPELGLRANSQAPVAEFGNYFQGDASYYGSAPGAAAQPGPRGPASSDPYAPIRQLPREWTPESMDAWYQSLKPHGFQSKYNKIVERTNDQGERVIHVELQQPGRHKYDTMIAEYKEQPDGSWQLANDPMQAPTRQESSSSRYDPRNRVRDDLMSAGVSERIASGLTRGPTSSAALAVDDIARGLRSAGVDGEDVFGRLNREVLRNSEKDIRYEERGASRAALIAGAIYGGGALMGGEAAAGEAAALAGAETAAGAAPAAGTGGLQTASGAELLTGTTPLTGGGSTASTLPSVGTMTGSTGGTTAGATSYAVPAWSGGGIGGVGGTTAATGGGMQSFWGGVGQAVGGGIVGAIFQPDQPDMSGVNEAARTSGQIAREQMDLARKMYDDQLKLFNEYRPIFDEAIALSMDSMRKSNQRADAQWADYENIWRPQEKRLAELSAEMASPGRIAQEAQRSADETAGQYDEAIKSSRDALIASGASPEKVAAMEASQRLIAAKGTGGAFSQGRRDQEAKAISLVDNSARFGRNMPSTGLATATLSGQQGGQAVSSYNNLSGSMAAPGQIMLPQVQTALNANQASGNLFANLANTQLQTDIARNNQIIGGIGAGMRLWGLGGGGR